MWCVVRNPVICSMGIAMDHLTHWPPGNVGLIFKSTIFKCLIQNRNLGTGSVITLRWMPQILTNEKSTLVQVMAWCHQATSHYLNQCWPSSMSSYDITRPQWIKQQVSIEKFDFHSNHVARNPVTYVMDDTLHLVTLVTIGYIWVHAIFTKSYTFHIYTLTCTNDHNVYLSPCYIHHTSCI